MLRSAARAVRQQLDECLVELLHQAGEPVHLCLRFVTLVPYKMEGAQPSRQGPRCLARK